MSCKLKVKFLGGLRFDERYVCIRISEVAPDFNIRDVYATPTYAILVFDTKDEVSSFFNPEVVEKLQESHLKPIPSPDQLHSKAVFITKLRPYVTHNTYENIMKEINDNNPVKVNSVFKLENKKYGTTSTLKLIFDTNESVNYVLRQGIKFFSITVSPDQIRKDEYIHLQQCFRCFSFEHVTRECTTNSQKCNICAGNHHYKDCTMPTRFKCLNCGGLHSSTFVRCPARKRKIEHQESDPSHPPSSSTNSEFPPLRTSTAITGTIPSLFDSIIPHPSTSISHPSTPSTAFSHVQIPNPLPSSDICNYSSVVKTPPSLPPPPKPSSSKPPLPTRLTTLKPKSIPSIPLPQRPSRVRPTPNNQIPPSTPPSSTLTSVAAADPIVADAGPTPSRHPFHNIHRVANLAILSLDLENWNVI